MKLRAVLIGLWSLMDISSGQYQHMMQLQHQVLQRANAGNLVRSRPQMLMNRQRWPVATNQIPIVAQRPYKPLFTYMKGPPQLYRGHKVGVKTTSYPNYWKNPTFRPPVIKDMFRNPIPMLNGLQTSTPTSAQKLLAASSPIQNLISSPSSSPNLLSGPLTKNYLASSISTNNFQSGHLIQTSRPSIAPATAAPPPVMYPIRVDGDGGPIHTIPAPNLSLADKPIVVPDYQNYIEDHANKIKSGHTYEVTEETNDHRHYPQSHTKNNMFFTESNSFSGTNLSPSNYYASISQKSFLPQASALVAQPVAAPSLTSEELFALLNDAAPQQQLSDTYSYPLLQQPQLQQHYLHQSYDNTKPIQPFKAVIQQANGADSGQNILFRQDPKYIEKVQEQLLRQSITQPQFQSFNYQEPAQNYQNHPDTEKFKSEIEKAIGDSIDMNSLHYNVVRNTKESTLQNNNFNTKQNSSRHIIRDSDASASFNVEAKTSFMPSSRNHDENSMSDISAVASTYLAEIDNIASSSIPPEYFASLSNKDTENALATLQAAGNLINVAQNDKNFKAIPEDYYADMSRYFNENSEADNSEFKPMQMGNDKNRAPIRIFVPEDYEDMNNQPTENIKVSASMNSGEMPKNDMTIVFENDETDDSILQQYDDITQIGNQNNSLFNIEAMLKENITPVESNKKADDVVVMVPQNVTNPTLDILTKDWKTSIIIKTKTSKTGDNSEFNKISEFGNRIRPKRN